MVIVEAAQNPIILNEFALFEKLNVKKDEIKATVKKILSGSLKIKNEDDENEVKEFIDKNEKSFKEIYKALDVDLSKYNATKEGRKALIALAVFILSSVAIIFAPAAVIFGSVIIPTEFILLLTEVFSFIYGIVKSFSVSSKVDSINEALNSLDKIKSNLKKLDVSKFDNENLTKKYNSLMEEIDNDMKSLRKKRS